MRYPGGKNAAGTWQKIICQIPPCKLLIEPFAGSAAITRHIRPAAEHVVIDRDPGALAGLAAAVPPLPDRTEVFCYDALEWMGRDYAAMLADPHTVVYADPPYLPGSTKSRLRYGAFNMTVDQHCALLDIFTSAECHVLLSGYRSKLYDQVLRSWRRLDYEVMTRGGVMVTESLWCNFPEPVELHDYRFLGATWRDRQNLRRMQKRWATRLEKMPVLKRQALLWALSLQEAAPEMPQAPGRGSPSACGGNGGEHLRGVSGVGGPRGAVAAKMTRAADRGGRSVR